MNDDLKKQNTILNETKKQQAEHWRKMQESSALNRKIKLDNKEPSTYLNQKVIRKTLNKPRNNDYQPMKIISPMYGEVEKNKIIQQFNSTKIERDITKTTTFENINDYVSNEIKKERKNEFYTQKIKTTVNNENTNNESDLTKTQNIKPLFN